MTDDDKIIVEWDDKYSVRIPFIDGQHKELIVLTNNLYQACLVGKTAASAQFKEAARGMMDYVKYHFTVEEQLLERINYPEAQEHKRHHEFLIKNLLNHVQDFSDGKTFVPNNFVRTLKDWILTHIAMMDTRYADYIIKMKKQQEVLNVSADL